MHQRSLVLLASLAALLAGCGALDKKKEKEKMEAATMKDQSKDPSFQGFLGRLRTAARMKDFEILGGLMAPDFGYRWDTPPAGETVFMYWNDNNVWPELNKVLNENFSPNGDYMVAPPAFAANPETYAGYRAGMQVVNGSWRFAYFVPAPSPGEQALPQ